MDTGTIIINHRMAERKKKNDQETVLNVSCLDRFASIFSSSLDCSSNQVLSSLIQSIVEIGSYVDSFSNITDARLFEYFWHW